MNIMRRAIPLIVVLALTLLSGRGIAFSQTSDAFYGILRSTDSGKSWKQVFRGDLDIDHLVIDKGGNILASTMNVKSSSMFSELYVCHPGTGEWKKVDLPATATPTLWAGWRAHSRL